MPKFSIITPTFERPEMLRRALMSVLEQQHTLWEMIIVNDSPQYAGYDELEAEYRDPRIKFLTNFANNGANASRNRGLKNVSRDSDWIIFLDDDDWLAPGALIHYLHLIDQNPGVHWFLTNRTDTRSEKRTLAPKDRTTYHYALDYLIKKRISGDATHCIEAKTAMKAAFPVSIKNGEEWLYFFFLSRSIHPFYADIDSTLTEGYADDGLNFRKRSRTEQILTLKKLVREGVSRKIVIDPFFILYIGLRVVRIFVKK